MLCQGGPACHFKHLPQNQLLGAVRQRSQGAIGQHDMGASVKDAFRGTWTEKGTGEKRVLLKQRIVIEHMHLRHLHIQ